METTLLCDSRTCQLLGTGRRRSIAPGMDDGSERRRVIVIVVFLALTLALALVLAFFYAMPAAD